MLYVSKEYDYTKTEEYLKLVSLGNKEARDYVILSNVSLIKNIISEKYVDERYDINDIEDAGLIGLIYAVDHYDNMRGASFSTFAYMCINSAILKFLCRRSNRYDTISLQDVFVDVYGQEKLIQDTVFDESIEDCFDKIVKEETYDKIREIVSCFNEVERTIVELYFGFYDEKRYTMEELSQIFFVSKQTISNKLIKSLKIIEDKLIKDDFLNSEKNKKITLKYKNSRK